MSERNMSSELDLVSPTPTSSKDDAASLGRNASKDPLSPEVPLNEKSDDLDQSKEERRAKQALRKHMLNDATNTILDKRPKISFGKAICHVDGDYAGKIELTETSAYPYLGFSFPTHKKWLIITSVFIVQLSMNFNAAIYGNVTAGLMDRFDVSLGMTKIGQMLFLVMYAIGCEAWAPWSEELGRFWVLQISLGLVNLWQIPCALAPNFASILVFRAFGGLSSAGGSVTLGMVADMWEPNDQHYAVSYVVFSSCAGSVIGPIFGGFIQTYLSWQWIFWISLIFGAVAQFIHAFVPETRTTVMLDRLAKDLRKQYPDLEVYGPNEIRGTFWKRTSWKYIRTLMWRPYKFLYSEPIVCFLSLLSGFSDALIFTGLDSFAMVLGKWNFSTVQVGLAFLPLLIGYVISTLSFLPVYHRDERVRREDIDRVKNDEPARFTPERRLWWLLFLVLLEPIGLIGFAASSLGPPIPWIVPLIFVALIGIANLAIYQATIDYMVAAYGPYAASATGGNGFARDFLAGIAALYAHPFYTKIKTCTKWQLPIPSFILSFIAMLLAVPVYIFYFHGEYFRTKSPYAESLAKEREAQQHEREEAISDSRNGTPTASRAGTRENSPTRADKGETNALDMAALDRRLSNVKTSNSNAVAVGDHDEEK